MGSLDGKIALITGGARGQGRAHAVRLASDGANIIAVDLCDQIASVPYPMATPDDLATTVKLVEDTGAHIVAVPADVRDPESLRTALQAGLDEFGRLDIVVANAGIAPMQAGSDGWRDVIDVNLTGVHNTVEVAMPTMIEQGDGGVIVNVASVAGLKPEPGIGAYVAAKHGVVGLTKSAAIEYAADNIRVNAVAPGMVATTTLSRSIPGDPQKFYASRQPGGRAAQPGEIASAIAWLLSDEASFVSGDTLLVDAALAQM